LRYCLNNSSQKIAPPTLSHGKGRWGKGLKTTINEGIATKNLTKKTPPIFSTWEDGWGKSLKRKVQYVTSINFNMRLNIFLFVLGVTISCSFIMSIVFCNSTSILLTFVSNVSPTSTLVYTCYSIFPLKANVTTSSTPIYIC
jgi:hypothetical protein